MRRNPTTAEGQFSRNGEQMTESVDDGWSFEEALARTSDPRRWDRYDTVKRQNAVTLADLRSELIRDLLAKIGTQISAAVPKPTNSDGGWTILDRSAVEKKIANERTDEITFFAPLKAPNAVEYLTDRGLADVFQRYIIDDAEVGVLRERTGLGHRFEGGRCPLGSSIDYHWPIEVAVSNFEFRLTLQEGVLSFEGLGRKATREVVALSEALVYRIIALRGLLTAGEIRAFGLSARLGQSCVPARQWARKNLSIDVANGDLCEEDDRGKFLPLWTGVELQSPLPEPCQPDQPPKQVAGARKRHPKGQEVERIITEHGIDVQGLGRKAAAVEVTRYMKSPPESASGQKALEAQVARIWRVINETR
jgi:hypothetical protein